MNRAKQLRKLQLCELDILKYLVNFCEQNKIRYYISGGTFLGAIRHKGFIPWDDDVDIAMPRKDYERFIKSYKSKKQKYQIVTFEDSSDFVYYPTRLVNDSIKVKNTSGEKELVWSAWIDVFPLDGMPKSIVLAKIHQFRLMYLRAKLKFTCFEQVNLKDKKRPFIERALIWVGLHFKFLVGGDSIKVLRKIDKTLKKYPSENSDIYMNFMGRYKLNSILDKKTYYADGAYYDFEGLKLFGPKNYDAYLSHFYGNYMKIPKKSDQNEHNTEILEEKK